jgi:uroporphyrin-III C-methyltransferase
VSQPFSPGRTLGNDAAPRVSLVGAGPGDPELITVKAVKRLGQADVVLYDRLVPKALFAHCRPDAVLYDVGKVPGLPRNSQGDISKLLVDLAQRGLRVVRLKGGDSFVFGRGGEEALSLAEAGIAFEVVPGISSAIAGPALAGIPVTHRGLASGVSIVTAAGDGGADLPDETLAAYAKTPGTLVFLMGVERLAHLVEGLLRHGRLENEPAALVRAASTDEQRCLVAPLGELCERAAAAGIRPPAVLVLGRVLELQPILGQPDVGVPTEALLASLAQLPEVQDEVAAALTRREQEVLRLAADGRTTRAIADHLRIRPKTAEHHRANAMAKLGLRGQTELVKYAIRSGLVAAA